MALPIALTVGVNALLFLGVLGWGEPAAPRARPAWSPPGAVVGSVWVALFGLIGAARWAAIRVEGSEGRASARWVVAILVLCLAHPFYTAGPAGLELGLAGTLLTAWVALKAIRELRPVTAAGARLLVPLMAWLVFASILTLDTIRVNLGA